MRVTVLLDERESATLARACGGRGVATLLREAGLREAAAMAPTELAGDTSARDRALVEEGVSIATGGVCGLGDAEAAEAVARVDARRAKR